jgi:DNA-binding protein H-NS
MVTLTQLETRIHKLQRQAEALRQRKSAEVIANIRALMEQYGLTSADLDAKGMAGTANAAGTKRRGRPSGSRNASNGVAKKAASHSKLPPKYRDPVSGLTWSGHARPPAWIKDAPDRDVFLINGARKAASSAAAKVKKGVGRGKAAASVTTAKKRGRPAGKKAARKPAESVAA